MKRAGSLDDVYEEEKGSSVVRRESRKWREQPEKALRASNIVMKATSASDQMTADAIQMLAEAVDKCGIENEIATYIKTNFERKYGHVWNCIVGRNFGSHLSCTEHVHLSICKISVILFRCD